MTTIVKINKPAAAKLKFREGTAREAWLTFITAQHGKPLQDVVKAAEANPPSLQPKGKYGVQGKVEPPMGWVRYFQRIGVVTLADK